jgi:hypothetical protein
MGKKARADEVSAIISANRRGTGEVGFGREMGRTREADRQGGTRISRLERIPDTNETAPIGKASEQKSHGRDECERGSENPIPPIPVFVSFSVRGAPRSLRMGRFVLAVRREVADERPCSGPSTKNPGKTSPERRLVRKRERPCSCGGRAQESP